MGTLGLIILWGGYTFGVLGFSKIKSAYGNSPALTLSDLALPSHRGTYLAAATSWGGTGSTATAGDGAVASSGGSGTAPPVGTPSAPITYVTPSYGLSPPLPTPTPNGYVPAT